MAPAQATRVTFHNILLATDFSSASDHALPFALSFARHFDSKLLVVHVAPPEVRVALPMEPVPAPLDLTIEVAQRQLKQFESDDALHAYPHETVLCQGDTWIELSRIIQEKNVDLVVVGAHDRGALNKLLWGSVAEDIFRHATCPVLSVGPNVSSRSLEHEQMRHLLFATDFSDSSSRALPYALSLAEENNAELTLLHVMEPMVSLPTGYMAQLIADHEHTLWGLVPDEAELWCKPEVRVESGPAAERIVEIADLRQSDLIVMGVHRGNLLANHLPWTVAHSVLRHARCPLLTLS